MGVKSNTTTPLSKRTYENLQLNAGITLVNFDLADISNAGALKTAIATAKADGSKLLGATRGGGTFTITREIRQVEADGVRFRFKGSEIVDSADAYLSETLIEVTPEHIKKVIGNADVTTSGDKTTISLRTAIEDEDYLDNIVWIGDTSKGFVAIELYNALNTADFTMTFADKTEGTVNCEFHAHQGDVDDFDEVPCKIHFFEAAGELGSITVTSAAGTNVGETALTTTNTLASGEHYAYKVGTTSTAPSAAYHDIPDYTWTEWNGSSAINVGASADGKKATIVVVNGSGLVTKKGVVTLAVKTA